MPGMSGHPCHGCRYSVAKLASVDGKRWAAWCRRYTQIVSAKCADYPILMTERRCADWVKV